MSYARIAIGTDGENLRKMGCDSNAGTSTITKRSIEDAEWDPFNINNYFI